MNYISVREASEQWHVTERWVQKLCGEQRVEGAILFGHSWMIPKDATRPEDLRKHRKIKQKLG